MSTFADRVVFSPTHLSPEKTNLNSSRLRARTLRGFDCRKKDVVADHVFLSLNYACQNQCHDHKGSQQGQREQQESGVKLFFLA